MTAYPEDCTLLVCCEDGYRTELSLRPDTREEPGDSVAQLHFVIERHASATDQHGTRGFVGLSREACRELGNALLRAARKRR